MDYIKNKFTKTKVGDVEPSKSNKKVYKKPEIKNYGKLKEITMSGSPGLGDSADPFLQQV